MKTMKILLSLLLAALLIFAAACAGSEENGSADTSDTDGVSEITENNSEDDGASEISEYCSTSAELSDSSQVTVAIPEDDGITCGFHPYKPLLAGDLIINRGGEGEVIDRLVKSLNEESFVHRFYIDEYGALPEDLTADPVPEPGDRPKVDFSDVYYCEYSTSEENFRTGNNVSYEEIKKLDTPFGLLLETVPLSSDMISELESEHGITSAEATRLYVSMIVEKLEQCGVYVVGWFDLYSFDSTRAYKMAVADGETGDKYDKSETQYPDEVYRACTELYFIVFCNGAKLEALEDFVESDINDLFKVKAMPWSWHIRESGVKPHPYDGDELVENGWNGTSEFVSFCDYLVIKKYGVS